MNPEVRYMVKEAYYIGQARYLYDNGLPVEHVKLAFTQQGWSDAEADALVKEAVYGAIAAGAAKLLPKVIPWAKGIAGKVPGLLSKGKDAVVGSGLGQRVAKSGLGQRVATGASGAKQQIATRVGDMGHRAGQGLQQAGAAFKKAPGQTLWQGTKNFGKGMMFMPGAKGVGGTLGKATAVGQIGSAVFGGGKKPQPQQQQMPRQYGQ